MARIGEAWSSEIKVCDQPSRQYYRGECVARILTRIARRGQHGDPFLGATDYESRALVSPRNLSGQWIAPAPSNFWGASAVDKSSPGRVISAALQHTASGRCL
jgi:hypothetical protein